MACVERYDISHVELSPCGAELGVVHPTELDPCVEHTHCSAG